MEGDMDSDDDSDDVILVNDSSKSSATSIHSATGVEPWALQTSWSAPAVLGQDHHQAMMPAAPSKVEDELPSTSYPKDVRVSSQYCLSYHRFINDEENDDESVTSDVEYGNEDADNADAESNADDDTTPVRGLVYSEDEYTDDDCSVDQEVERAIKDAIEESSEDETSSQTDQTLMVKKCDIVHITKVKSLDQTEEDSSSYLSSGPSGNDVTSDDETTSQVGEVCVDEIETMFLISLIWTLIRNPLYGVFQAGLQFVQDIVKGKEDEMDVDEKKAVVVH
ncbi:uncharacterized protein LOC115923239 [Strongylocentrotus purpuratus]|uniref:Uncharacterized protein n=1 Tax=Strongylocentrotus purpuratus TaxID=7668 RepID=A0A7M7SXY2_STRPU|nr:uncharacterized protein LOC115923239 [Strongylocentrotus purpuratus]